MSDLVFHSEGGSAAVSVAHELSIALSEGRLTADGGPVLASHTDGVWRIGEVSVTRISCAGPIFLRLATLAERYTFGPLHEIVIGNNTIWAKSGPLARYNAFTRTWALSQPAVAADLPLADRPSAVAA